MISFKFLVALLFGGIVAAIIALWNFSFLNSLELNRSATWVRHTHEVLDVIGAVSSSYKEIQLESNGYFATGDSTFLHGYYRSVDTVRKRMDALRNVTRDNVRQQENVRSLKGLIDSLIAYTDPVAGVLSAGADARLEARLRKNRTSRDHIAHQLDMMEDIEHHLLTRCSSICIVILAFSGY